MAKLKCRKYFNERTFVDEISNCLEEQIAGLSYLWLEITHQCNLSCKHCYAECSPKDSVTGEVTCTDWIRLISEAKELGCNAIQFIGGEPALHPNLKELLRHAKDCSFDRIELYTNGTLLNREHLMFLKQNGISIATSVYSDSARIHDFITSHEGSFQKTVAFIRQAQEFGLEMRVGVVAMKENDQSIGGTVDFLKSLGIRDVKVDRERKVGRSSSHDHLEDKDGELCGNCWKGTLCISASGEVFPCVFSRHHKLGDARSPLREIVESKRTHEVRRHLVRKHQQSHAPVVNCDPYCNPYFSPCNPQLPCNPTVCNPQRVPCAPCGPLNPQGVIQNPCDPLN